MLSAALIGVEAVIVSVEVDVVRGLPVFTTVGLPDWAVRESCIVAFAGSPLARGEPGEAPRLSVRVRSG
jgi:hypothetical protein